MLGELAGEIIATGITEGQLARGTASAGGIDAAAAARERQAQSEQ